MEHLPLAEGLALRSGSLAPGTALQRGNFVILSLIGEGGFGSVYRARQERLEREVAIKVLHPGNARQKDIVERFRREALAAASLSHPHVLPVYDFDFDEEHGLWFLAMRYVEGASGLEHLRPPLEFNLAVRIVGAVAGALDAAHARNIVHRDVKPANVLLDGTWPLLTDFGIAHLANVETLTATGVAIGTPMYMSPEQALGQELGPSSDQYSLAVMAYQLLAGRTPFKGDTPSILYQHVHEPPPSPAGINHELTAGASEVILCAMSKRPADRFASCTDFADALSEAIRGRPITSVSAAAVLEKRTPTPVPTPETLIVAEPAPPPTPQSEATAASESMVSQQPNSSSVPRPAESIQRQPTTGYSRTITLSPTRIGIGAFATVALIATLAVIVIRNGPATVPPPSGPSGQARGGASAAAPGTILLSDDFDDPSRALLPTNAAPGATYRLGYVGGEYEIAGHAGNVMLQETYKNATLSFDARFPAQTTGRYLTVACRAGPDGYYGATIYPDSGRFVLDKAARDKTTGRGVATSLLPERQAQAILTGNTRNHVDITCSGDTIEVAINGTTMGAVKDPEYAEGFFMIVTGAAQPDDAEEAVVRLDNLVVRQR